MTRIDKKTTQKCLQNVVRLLDKLLYEGGRFWKPAILSLGQEHQKFL
jgi:hypothetical protein